MVKKAKILLYMIALIFGISLLLPSNMETVEAASPKLSKSSVTLTKGKNTTITIKNNEGKTINWFTANKSVASIKKLSNTEVCITAKETGSTNIAAFDYTNGKLYRCNVTVEAPKISKKSATITKDETVTVKLNGTTRNATWKISNKAVATIKKTAKNTYRITGNKAGTAKVTAKLNGITYTCTLKVTMEKPSISMKSATITKGNATTVKLSGTTRDAIWKTSNNAVAAIKKTAKNTYIVTGLKAGTSKITAKLNGVTYTCTVKVENPKLSNTSKTMMIGDSVNLSVKDSSKFVTWISYDTSIATVSKSSTYTGKITARKAGQTYVIAVVDGLYYWCLVTVEAKISINESTNDNEAKENPSLSTTSIVLRLGDSYDLKVSGTSGKVSWKSADNTVVDVNKTSDYVGKITAKSVGSATITASVNGISLICSVLVENPVLSAATLSLVVGDSARLEICGTYNTSISWETSNDSVISISKSKYSAYGSEITANKAGTATVKATVSSISLTCDIVVADMEVIKLSEMDTTVVLEEYATISCSALPENTYVEWIIEDSGILYASNKYAGQRLSVYGLEIGTTKVKVIYDKKIYIGTITVVDKPFVWDFRVLCRPGTNESNDNNYVWYTIHEFGNESYCPSPRNSNYIATQNVSLFTKNSKIVTSAIVWEIEDVSDSWYRDYYERYVGNEYNYKEPVIKSVERKKAYSNIAGEYGYQQAVVANIEFYECTKEVKVTAKYNGEIIATWIEGDGVGVLTSYDAIVYDSIRKELQDELWDDTMTDLEKLRVFANYIKANCWYADTEGSPGYGYKWMLLVGLGSGDCISGSSVLIDCAMDLGLEAYHVNGVNTSNPTNPYHFEARIIIDGIAYTLDATPRLGRY